MRIAIQVLIHRSSSYLQTLLRSLQNQTFQDWKLFVLDNSIEEEESRKSRQLLEQSGIDLEYVRSVKNLGFIGHNVLFAKHEAEFILVLNDDAWLMPDCLESLVKRCETDARCGSVAPLVYRWDFDQASQGEVGDAVIDTAGLEYSSLAKITDRFSGIKKSEKIEDLSKSCEVFGVSGAAAFYRRSAVLDSSPDGALYDPTFFMYKEDVDLAIRLRRKGHVSFFELNAVVFHGRAVGVRTHGWLDRLKEERRRNPGTRRQTYRNQWMIYVYHLSISMGPKDLFLSFVHQFARCWLVFLSSPVVYFSAWLDILKSLPWAIGRRRALKLKGLAPLSVL